jgi:hypothetical protein
MTMMTMDPHAAEEVEKVSNRLAKATAAYMTRLKDVVDITTLTTGAHGYDYAVSVSQAAKPRILPLLADLTFEIESEFGVTIRTLAVASGTEDCD